jgi:hypothetical protein
MSAQMRREPVESMSECQEHYHTCEFPDLQKLTIEEEDFILPSSKDLYANY